MSIEVLRPAASLVPGLPSAPVVPIAPPLPRDRSFNLALVANGKPNSAELLDALARRLQARLPVAEIRRYRKPSVSVAPHDDDMREIAEWAHAVLTAVGD